MHYSNIICMKALWWPHHTSFRIGTSIAFLCACRKRCRPYTPTNKMSMKGEPREEISHGTVSQNSSFSPLLIAGGFFWHLSHRGKEKKNTIFTFFSFRPRQLLEMETEQCRLSDEMENERKTFCRGRFYSRNRILFCSWIEMTTVQTNHSHIHKTKKK